MSILSLSFVIAFILYLIFGLFILNMSRKPGTGFSLHLHFFVICIVFALWSLNHAFLVSAPGKEECWFWYKLSLPFLSFFPSADISFHIGSHIAGQ